MMSKRNQCVGQLDGQVQKSFFVGFYDYLVYNRLAFGKTVSELKDFCFRIFLDEMRRLNEIPDIWLLLEENIPKFVALENKEV